MRVRIVEYEGTPEEIAQAMASLPPASQDSPAAPLAEYEPEAITKEVALEALTRRPLSENHAALIKTLYDAHPGKVGYEALCEALDVDAAQMKGVLGSLGRRLRQTPGANSNMWMIDVEGTFNEEPRYGLPEVVRDAIEEADLV